MKTDFRYQLESKKLTGHQPRKLTCPHCGKKKCLVRYVDTKNGYRYIADSVGKCDHQHSCGYHYKPSEYYHDNQWAREPTVNTENYCKPVSLPPFQPLPKEFVLRSQSPNSTFWRWFSTDVAKRLDLSPEQIQRVFDDYLIGATNKGNVIFWQIDHQKQVHGGHIMHYRFDGHREGFQGWTHIPLIREGLLPPNWTLYQCLFGEHLLSRQPEAHVCLVESEKTALVMSACHPDQLWLATAGSSGLSPERVKCLCGRRVTLFPDSGCYEKWQQQMQLTTGIKYNISEQLESYPPNTDLCDILLKDS
jgi:transcription elongation factor Elf1